MEILKLESYWDNKILNFDSHNTPFHFDAMDSQFLDVL